MHSVFASPEKQIGETPLNNDIGIPNIRFSVLVYSKKDHVQYFLTPFFQFKQYVGSLSAYIFSLLSMNSLFTIDRELSGLFQGKLMLK